MSLQELAEQASRLSVSERLTLVNWIIKSLQSEIGHMTGNQNIEDKQADASLFKQMRGFLSTDQPAPTDAEVEALRNERLIEKYT